MSLVEVMLAMSVVMIGVGSYLSAVVQVDLLRRSSDETATAVEAARTVIARLQATAFEDVLASFDDDPQNDPGGPGTALGATFTVGGLSRRGSANPVGEVVLPTNGVGEVREDLELPALGLPRDLDGDGVVDAADHSADCLLLPVLVRVRWDAEGEQLVELKTVVCAR